MSTTVTTHEAVRRTSSAIVCSCRFVTAIHLNFAGAVTEFDEHLALAGMRRPVRTR